MVVREWLGSDCLTHPELLLKGDETIGATELWSTVGPGAVSPGTQWKHCIVVVVLLDLSSQPFQRREENKVTAAT